MPATVIRIRDLRFRWANDAGFCLDIPLFEAQAGERIFLHGPSGSGKTPCSVPG